MNPTAQRQQAPATVHTVTSVGEARKLADRLMHAMTDLLGLIERETELVRAGKLREALAFEPEKTSLSREYFEAARALKTNHEFLQKSAPELLTTLHRHHDVFRAMLQINLTVLATAHAVSEGIVRGVNAEVQRRNVPNTYTAAGRRAAPGAPHMRPLAVSRSL